MDPSPHRPVACLVLLLSFLVPIAGAIAAPAGRDCSITNTYIGNRPKEADPGWNVEAQGIGHDDANWYITQKNRLWKIPGTHDLAEGFSCDSSSCKDLADTELGQLGYDHLGDLEYYHGYLCIPVEFPDKKEPAALALFRASDLQLVAYHLLPELHGTAGWCAVDASGIAYLSESDVTELARYTVNWDTFEIDGLIVEPAGKVSLLDEAGDPLELVVMQGGVFSDQDFLYLIDGDALNDCDGCGIHVFDVTLAASGEPCSSGPGDCVARRVDRSKNGEGPFNYQYNPGQVFNFEEPEGITFWDLTAPGAPAVPGITTGGLPVASSQLHALLLDNDLTSDDDVYVKHYQVEVVCAPQAGIKVSPLAIDFGDVDIGGSASAPVTISNAGDAALHVDSFAVVGGGSPPFTVAAPPLPAEVAPGGSISGEVQFTPGSDVKVTATLEVGSDDPDRPIVSVLLAGAGLSLTGQAAALLEQFDEAVGAGALVGTGSGKSASLRLQALRNMIVRAQSLIGVGRYADACKQLADAYARTDGASPPSDFVTGPAAAEIAAEIADLRSHLPCGP